MKYELYFETMGAQLTREFSSKAKAISARNSDWLIKGADLVIINQIDSFGDKTMVMCWVDGKKQN